MSQKASFAPRAPTGDQPEPRREDVRADLRELQRLMEAFGSELEKLDEALRTLSAYVTRMRDRAVSGSNRVLH